MAVAPELIPELAPEAEVVVTEAVPVLAKLVAFLVAFGVICLLAAFINSVFFLANKVTSALTFGLFTHVPGLGGVEQAISQFFGNAISGLDSHIGYSFHQLARIGDQLGHRLLEAAMGLWIIAALIETSLNPHQWKILWRHLKGQTDTTLDYSKKWAAKTQVNTRAIRHAETGPIGAAAHTAVRPVRAEVHKVEEWVYPAVRGVEHAVEGLPHELHQLEHRVAKVEGLLGATAMTGVVAVALEALGAEASRCEKTGRFNKALCGAPDNLLNSLLAGLLIVATPISIVELAKACQKFTGEVESGLRWFVRELS